MSCIIVTLETNDIDVTNRYAEILNRNNIACDGTEIVIQTCKPLRFKEPETPFYKDQPAWCLTAYYQFDFTDFFEKKCPQFDELKAIADAMGPYLRTKLNVYDSNDNGWELVKSLNHMSMAVQRSKWLEEDNRDSTPRLFSPARSSEYSGLSSSDRFHIKLGACVGGALIAGSIALLTIGGPIGIGVGVAMLVTGIAVLAYTLYKISIAGDSMPMEQTSRLSYN